MTRQDYTIDGHTVEFGTGASNLDPWSADYANDNGIGVVCSADISYFARIDGERIYRLGDPMQYISLPQAIENGGFHTWDEFEAVLDIPSNRFVGLFSELKKSLDDLKRRSEKFKLLSPEEKKARIMEMATQRRVSRKMEKESEK